MSESQLPARTCGQPGCRGIGTTEDAWGNAIDEPCGCTEPELESCGPNCKLFEDGGGVHHFAGCTKFGHIITEPCPRCNAKKWPLIRKWRCGSQVWAGWFWTGRKCK